MFRIDVLSLVLWLIIAIASVARGQNEASINTGSNDLTSAQQAPTFDSQAPRIEATGGVQAAFSDQPGVVEFSETDSLNVADELNQFNSFDNTSPGSEIGSNFFGLNDNFEDGLLIRSGNVAMKIGGFLKVDFIQDFNPIGNTDAFNVVTIEVGAEPRKNTRFHARQTRLNWDTRWDSERGPFRMFVEGDFFFNQRENFELGENRFRLRHAYAQHGKWTIGQTWTTLSDPAASPATLDFEGQVASITTRRTQIRWTDDIGKSDWSLALALEDPFTIIEVADDVVGEPRTQTPDAVARLRLSRPKMQFQAAGVVRKIGFQPVGQPLLEATAWGVNFTSVVQLTEQSKFYYEVLYGSGIGSFKGQPDLGPTVTGGEEIIGSLGWMVGGTYEWTERLSSNVTFAQNRIVNVEDLFPDELDNVTYFSSNLIFAPTTNTNFGIEYLYGLRENFDGQSAQANRIQVAFTYFLP